MLVDRVIHYIAKFLTWRPVTLLRHTRLCCYVSGTSQTVPTT